MFNKGDKVVCGNDNVPEGFSSNTYPEWVEKGRIYTVRETLYNDDIVVGVLVEELVNPIVWQELLQRHQEAAFATWRFNIHKTDYMVKEEKNSESMTVTSELGKK